MRLTLPTHNDLTELIDHRDDASVSIYLPSSPIANQTEAVQLALRSAITDAEGQLKAIGVPRQRTAELADAVGRLESDREFWQYQSNALAVFAAPGLLRAFRLANSLEKRLSVGDRFDIGPLLRSVTFPHDGFVLSVTEGAIRLLEITATGHPTVIELPGLPDDVHSVLEHGAHDGRFDQRRADGRLGPKAEQRRFCRLVEDAVLKQIGDSALPMILAGSRDLEPAYRVVNTYPGLLEKGIDTHPDSASNDELDARARAILDEHYADQLVDWRETFGARRSNGLATSQLSEVAKAATASAVDELLFDMNSTLEGSIDDFGALQVAGEPGPGTYGLVDEIAARVLRSGGTVRAARAEDMPDDDTVVAALLRFPI
ncbi:MAG: hypothetical protein ABIW36_13460 [Terrimesophilobacter sp.]